MKRFAAAIALGVFFGSLLLVQQQRIGRLLNENANLRGQLNQMVSLQETNEDLSKRLKAAAETSQANEAEFLRLRGQTSRLRQLEKENAQLSNQVQQSEKMREVRLTTESSGLPTAMVVIATNSPPLDVTDLGSLELEDSTPVRFDLGGGTNCIVTPKALPDGAVTIQLKTEITNQDGTISELGAARITTKPGRHGSISVGDRMIGPTK
jgi:hypothetical protein